MTNFRFEFYGVLFALLLLNVWYLSGLAIEEKVLPIYYEHLIRAVIVACSAALGAFLAFKFNSNLADKKEQKEEQAENAVISAKLNRALFHMIRQIKSVRSINETINECKSAYQHAFAMRVVRDFEKDIKIDLDELALILSDEMELLLEIDRVQSDFQRTMECFDQRSDFYLNVLMPELEAKKLLGKGITEHKIKKKLNPATFETAFSNAEDLIEISAKTYDELLIIHQQLFEASKRKFPEDRFLQLTKEKSDTEQ